MARRGRPTKLTRKLIAEMATVLAAGNTMDKSADYCGIDGATAFRWQARGRAEQARLAKSKRAKPKASERPYCDFSDAVKKARAKAQVRAVAIINLAAPTNWTAAAWFLERSDPDHWGRKERREHTGLDGGPIAASLTVRFVGGGKATGE